MKAYKTRLNTNSISAANRKSLLMCDKEVIEV